MEANTPNQNHAIDMRVIEELRELGGADDPGLLVELIELFLADAPLHIEEVERSLVTGDIQKIERAAHTLKSSSANIGATNLSSICRQIEELARSKRQEQIPPLLAATTQNFAAVRTALIALKG